MSRPRTGRNSGGTQAAATALFPTLAPLVEDLVARTRERLGDRVYQSAAADEANGHSRRAWTGR
jgi:hypothetical protein